MDPFTNPTKGEDGNPLDISKRFLWFFKLLEKFLPYNKVSDVQFNEPSKDGGFSEGTATLTLGRDERFIPSSGRYLNTPILPPGSVVKLSISQGSDEEIKNVVISYWVQQPINNLFGSVYLVMKQDDSLIAYRGKVYKYLYPNGPIRTLGEGIPSFILKIIKEMKQAQSAPS